MEDVGRRMVDDVSKECSSVSMSMPKAVTLQIGILGHTDEEEYLESSRDNCRKKSKDRRDFSKCLSKVSTQSTNYDR